MSKIIPAGDPNATPETNWVVVAEAFGMTEAEILAGSLKAAGIPAWISHESAVTAIGIGIGHIVVVVPLEYEEQARDLLAGEADDAYKEDAPQLPEPDDDDDDAM